MPLRAIINNKEIISSFLTREEWGKLIKKVKLDSLEVVISETNQKGVLKTNKNGTQYFAHKRGEKPENWKSETIKNLDVKSQILIGCKDIGWNAISEYIDNDLYIDVVAQNDKHKIGFKVILTSIKLSEVQEQQERYKANGIRVCWLFKKPPKELEYYDGTIEANKEIPSFKLIENEEKKIRIQLNNKTFTIGQFTVLLLSKKIKFSTLLKAKEQQEIEVHFFEHTCYKCKEHQHAYFIQDTLQSYCNNEIHIENTMWDDDSFKYHPAILNAVIDFKNSELGKHLKIGKIKKRYSRTTNSSYLSFGCHKCDTLFGDWFLQEDIREAEMYGSKDILLVEIKSINLKDSFTHWCYSEDGNHCT